MLSLGAGVDFQSDLDYGASSRKYDYAAYDVHWDQPVGPEGGAVTCEAAYIHINNGPNAINYTHLTRGDNADIYSAKAGYLLPWHPFSFGFQPSIHYGRVDSEGWDATNIFGGGMNWFIKGHANKLSFDVTAVEQGDETHGSRPVQDHLLVTLPLAMGF